MLVAGGLAVGCLAELADLLGADSRDVLFSGQAALPNLIVEGSAGVVVVLLAAKAIAYGICLGCGFRGGPVFPAIFLGVALATLLVGTAGLDAIPAAVLAASGAWLTVTALDKRPAAA